MQELENHDSFHPQIKRGCCDRAASAGDTDRWAHGGVAEGCLEVEAEKRLRVGRSSDGLENEGRRAGRREGKIPQKVPNLT